VERVVPTVVHNLRGADPRDTSRTLQTPAMFPDDVIDLLEAQLGVIARFQLREHVAPSAIDQHVRMDRLRPVARGVYRVAGGAVLPDQLALAAALVARPEATITGPFVLSRHRLDGFEPDAPFEVLLQPGRSDPRAGGPYRRDPLPDRPVDRLGEVRLARPLDALLDSGRFRDRLGDRQLRLAYDQLRWRKLLRVEDLRAAIEQRRDDPGAQAVAEVLDLDDLRSESEGERRLGRILGMFRPGPEAQVWVSRRRRVDWFFRPLRLGVEYDGSVDHAHRRGRQADLDRDRELAREGIRLELVTAADLRQEEVLVARIAGALALRARELRATAPVFIG
jgi:hypothetical protein